MSKPVGTFNKDRNCIYWQLGDVELSAGMTQTKLLARFVTGDAGVLAKQGRCEARWEIGGIQALGLGSGLGVSVRGGEGAIEDDPFKDEGSSAVQTAAAGWKDVVAVRKLVAGTYQAL